MFLRLRKFHESVVWLLGSFLVIGFVDGKWNWVSEIYQPFLGWHFSNRLSARSPLREREARSGCLRTLLASSIFQMLVCSLAELRRSAEPSLVCDSSDNSPDSSRHYSSRNCCVLILPFQIWRDHCVKGTWFYFVYYWWGSIKNFPLYAVSCAALGKASFLMVV